MDIDATGFTNNAYAQHQRSADDISQIAENKDVFSEHNFMALMANTMSEEDYNRALEDGFDLKDLNSKEAVTIVDKIKSVLLEAIYANGDYDPSTLEDPELPLNW